MGLKSFRSNKPESGPEEVFDSNDLNPESVASPESQNTEMPARNIRISKAFSKPSAVAEQTALVPESKPVEIVNHFSGYPDLYKNEDGHHIAFHPEKGCLIVRETDELPEGWFTHLKTGDRVFFNTGVIHKEDGPAWIRANGKGEIWYQHNKIHRDEEDGPALNIITPWGDKRIAYYKMGEMHAINHPANTVISVSGMKWVMHYVNGRLHNTVGPASICIGEDGRTLFERHCVNGVDHRNEDDGPAIVDGKYMAYKLDGEFHRLGGPAVIDEYGHEFYYLQGLEVTKKQVATAFLENKQYAIGKASKADSNLGKLSQDEQEKAMKDRINAWKADQEAKAKTATARKM